jgi:hypothetical protein
MVSTKSLKETLNNYMENTITEQDNLDSLIKELQAPSSEVLAKKTKKQQYSLNPDDLEQFLLDQASQLIKDSTDAVSDLKGDTMDGLTPEALESFASMVRASATAIESLNKILISRETNKNRIKVKQMDIESKKTLLAEENKVRLIMNREDLLKKMIADSLVIEAEVIE